MDAIAKIGVKINAEAPTDVLGFAIGQAANPLAPDYVHTHRHSE